VPACLWTRGGNVTTPGRRAGEARTYFGAHARVAGGAVQDLYIHLLDDLPRWAARTAGPHPLTPSPGGRGGMGLAAASALVILRC
jgi:hypothetical protein